MRYFTNTHKVQKKLKIHTVYHVNELYQYLHMHKYFTLGNLYNIIIFTFHVLSYFVIEHVSDNYTQSENRCTGPNTHGPRTLMMFLNTIAFVNNFVLGVEFSRLFVAIVEFNNGSNHENSRVTFCEFREGLKTRANWLLIPVSVSAVCLVSFPIVIGTHVLTPCFKHNFDNEYKQLLIILIVSVTMFYLNVFSFVFFYKTYVDSFPKQYYMLARLYNQLNTNTKVFVGIGFGLFLGISIWLFERTPNTWINVIFWVGFVISAINIFTMVYEKAIYATSEICFITIMGVVTNIVASAFLFDDGNSVTDKNIIAMCFSNVFLLCVGIGLGLGIGIGFFGIVAHVIICTVSYISFGLFGYPESVFDVFGYVGGLFDGRDEPVPTQASVSASALDPVPVAVIQGSYASTGLNVV